MKNRKIWKIKPCCGFTLVELILVVLILSITAMIAVPMFSSAADVQVRSAANRLAADLDYARGLAITRQKNYEAVFSPTTSSTGTSYYYLCDEAGTIIDNPLTGGKHIVLYRPDAAPYTVQTYEVRADSRVHGVRIDAIEGAAGNAVRFNYLGMPSSLTGTGWITLKSKDGKFVLYVKVEMLTGYVTVTDTKE